MSKVRGARPIWGRDIPVAALEKKHPAQFEYFQKSLLNYRKRLDRNKVKAGWKGFVFKKFYYILIADRTNYIDIDCYYEGTAFYNCLLEINKNKVMLPQLGLVEDFVLHRNFAGRIVNQIIDEAKIHQVKTIEIFLHDEWQGVCRSFLHYGFKDSGEYTKNRPFKHILKNMK
jgi:hypothetical protein